MIRIVISGCCGKMGRRIIALAAGDKQFTIRGAMESKAHPAIGKKISQILSDSALDIEVKDNPAVIQQADALIEFSTPSATIEHLALAAEYRKAMVIGTTGLDSQQIQKIQEASENIAIVFSPNMSLGVNLMFRLVQQAAQKLGRAYKADIWEAHHVHKQDAPSGTARRLAELIKEAPGRKEEKVAIDSVREGEIVGDHQVRFNGPQDSIIIKHSAKTRDIFARGALAAARFVANQGPGLYNMQDVIG